MKMILHQKQKDVIKNNARFKVIRAGRRSGKTILEREDMSFEAISQKDRNIFYICPTQIQAREIIWEMFKKRLSAMATFHEQRLEIKVLAQDDGYSYIKLGSWENRENFRGKPADKIVFDEVDTMRDFFIGWQEIFRPALMDSGGGASFIGTPKKENPNLRRLEKIAEIDSDYAVFHFTSLDNPYLSDEEKKKTKDELDFETYRQEILAEYVDSQGALFRYDALIDIFSNTITKTGKKYLIVDIADDGSDKTIFSFWEDLEEYRREEYAQLNTEIIVNKIREYASQDQIPYSQIAVDAIGVGAGIASSSILKGIIGFKSSYQAIKTERSIVYLPDVSFTKEAPLLTEYRNLRSQCIFTLADLVNNHKIASRLDGKMKENIIEELTVYQDASKGDGKQMATQKEDVRALIGRSPDHSDCFIMRMYFEVMGKMIPDQSEEQEDITRKMKEQFEINKVNILNESNK